MVLVDVFGLEIRHGLMGFWPFAAQRSDLGF